MNKTFITIIAGFGIYGISLSTARSQLVVEDVAHIAQDAANQVVDLAKYAQMVENQVKQIDTMTQELNQVTFYVKAFGDPSQLTGITGANQLVSGLKQSGVGQGLTSLQQGASGIQSLSNTVNGLYQGIGNTALSGITVTRVTDNYKPFSAVEKAASNYTSVENDVTQRRNALKSQIADTVSQLQAATTDAETQKLHAVLTAQSAQLQALNQEVSQAASQTVVQDISNRNDRQKQQQSQDEEIAADRQDAFTKYGGMMQPDVTSDLRFGGNQ
jgi:membrane-associated HD superfamily phosphohydrolase